MYFLPGRKVNRVVAHRVRSTTSTCGRGRLAIQSNECSRLVAAQADVAERPPAVAFDSASKGTPLKIGVNGMPDIS